MEIITNTKVTYGIKLLNYRGLTMNLWVYDDNGKPLTSNTPYDLTVKLSDYRTRNPDGDYVIDLYE